VLHLKDLYCTKIVHILRILRGVDGHRREPGISCNCTQKLLYQRNRGSVKRNQPKRAEQSLNE